MRGTGHISEAESWFINGLLEEASLQLQVACCSVEKQATRSASRECESSVGSTCFMSIILYGPYSLAEDVGRYCGEAEVFLQDPIGCDQNAKYWNPHRLSTCEQEVIK